MDSTAPCGEFRQRTTAAAPRRTGACTNSPNASASARHDGPILQLVVVERCPCGWQSRRTSPSGRCASRLAGPHCSHWTPAALAATTSPSSRPFPGGARDSRQSACSLGARAPLPRRSHATLALHETPLEAPLGPPLHFRAIFSPVWPARGARHHRGLDMTRQVHSAQVVTLEVMLCEYMSCPVAENDAWCEAT